MLHRVVVVLGAALALAVPSLAEAGHHRRGCCFSGCGEVAVVCGSAVTCGTAPAACAPVAPAAPVMVEKTIYVPTYVTETRTVKVTQYRTEPRERRYMVPQCVPETKAVEQTYTVMVPQPRTRTESYVVCKPVWREVTQNFTVSVPYQVKKTGTRTEYRTVTDTVMRNVRVDQGQWVEKVVPAPQNACATSAGCGAVGNACAPCGGCGPRRGCGCASNCGPAACGDACGSPAPVPVSCTYKVWVPNYVTKQVPCQVNKVVPVEVPYEYMVTVCKEEPRTRTVKVVEYLSETKSREVPYTELVPHQKTRTVNVTTYKTVQVEKVDKFTVQVPYQVDKEIQVQVCKMVPKVIQVPVYPAAPACAPSAPCYSPCRGAAANCGAACRSGCR